MTTPEEWEGFYIVRAMLAEAVDPKNETREPIEEVSDIYRFGRQLKETAARYEE